MNLGHDKLTIDLLDVEFYFVSRFDGLEHLRVLNFVDHGHCRHVQPWDSSMIEGHLIRGFIDLFDLRGNSRGRLRNCDDWKQSDRYKESEAPSISSPSVASFDHY